VLSDYFLGCLVCYVIGLAVAYLIHRGRYGEAIILFSSWAI